MTVTAREIIKMLGVKHHDDIFITECKNGPTHTAEHLRMDVWVMNRSWVNNKITVYEVKVSRNDFLGDDKWRRYLPYCNELYFVCPYGLIDPSELDEGIGLMVASKNGTRLFKKRKAVYRPADVPDDLYKYILMARVNVQNRDNFHEDKAAFWKNWLEQRDENKRIGWEASQGLQDIYRRDVTNVERNHKRLQEQINSLEEVRAFLVSHDIDPKQWKPVNHLKDIVDGRDIEHLADAAKRLVVEIGHFTAAIDAKYPKEDRGL